MRTSVAISKEAYEALESLHDMFTKVGFVRYALGLSGIDHIVKYQNSPSVNSDIAKRSEEIIRCVNRWNQIVEDES